MLNNDARIRWLKDIINRLEGAIIGLELTRSKLLLKDRINIKRNMELAQISLNLWEIRADLTHDLTALKEETKAI